MKHNYTNCDHFCSRILRDVTGIERTRIRSQSVFRYTPIFSNPTELEQNAHRLRSIELF